MGALIVAVVGWLLHAAAWAAGAAHGRLDRAARALTGGPDPVDQHAAEAQAVTSLRGWEGQYYAGVSPLGRGEQSETFRRLQEVSRVRWSPAADAIEGRRRATAERAAPAPTTTHLEPVGGDEMVVVLSSLLTPAPGVYPGEPSPQVIRGQAQALAAAMERSNLTLVRRTS